MAATAFIFPGQGSQAVGMGKALAEAFPAAQQVFAEVDDALGQHLSDLIWNGPESELTLTANAQPALMAVSLAAVRALEAEADLDLARDVAFVAGHSLGEYAALAAAGALSVGDTARLLRIRGDAMQQAVPVGVGAMAALLGTDAATASAISTEAAQGEICQTANDNGGGQVVISGHRTAVERAIELAKVGGVKRAMLLSVSAPFHCALMQPAADVMRRALENVVMKKPVVPLVANVLAADIREPSEIIAALVTQVTGSVRWLESMQFLERKGVSRFVEVGAGKVLSGLMRRIAAGAEISTVGVPDDVRQFATR
jgi:[acyl-carrier-protein] S-malonyltransferase